MPSWNDLVNQLEATGRAAGGPGNPAAEAAVNSWLAGQRRHCLDEITRKRSGRNVLFYFSGFLQKPDAPIQNLSITHEDINGFMTSIYGLDCSKGLTLILHTPGGVINAAETIVAYLWSKFTDIEVIVPVYALSAGTMLALASNRVIMGRQSQLGPIDPQMPFGGRSVSARAVVEQFDAAKKEISADASLAALWAPVLHTMGPSLLIEARYALQYGERMVREWLRDRMFAGEKDAALKGATVATFFNDAGTHMSHGRRIDRAEARSQGLTIEDLEDDQELQEAVLTLYHLGTISVEKSPSTKFILGSHGRMWVKTFMPPQVSGPLILRAPTPVPPGVRPAPPSTPPGSTP